MKEKTQTNEALLLIRKKRESDRILALAGNPNVGKSSVFNALTGMHQHTGNWPGKTVSGAQGYFEGARRGYTYFKFYGCTGGRCDHTFANYALLVHIKERGHNAVLVDGGYEIFAIKNEKISIKRRTGTTVSLFAFGSEARGVTLTGLKYPLSDQSLLPSLALGVSNELISDEATVEVRDGTLLIMLET